MNKFDYNKHPSILFNVYITWIICYMFCNTFLNVKVYSESCFHWTVFHPVLGYNVLLTQCWGIMYCGPNILYNIIKFIVKRNRILNIYYCKIFYNLLKIYCQSGYPISVSIKALQIQIPKLSNNIIINSSTARIVIESLICQKLYYFRYYFYKKLFRSK